MTEALETVELDELRARLALLEDEVTELRLLSLAADRPGRDGAPVPVPKYPTVDAWVDAYFLPTFVRATGGEFRWCSEWAQHAEAVTRFESLWRAWEVLRLDPGVGMSTWLVGHLDPQLSALTGRGGPFAACSTSRHVS